MLSTRQTLGRKHQVQAWDHDLKRLNQGRELLEVKLDKFLIGSLQMNNLNKEQLSQVNKLNK